MTAHYYNYWPVIITLALLIVTQFDQVKGECEQWKFDKNGEPQRPTKTTTTATTTAASKTKKRDTTNNTPDEECCFVYKLADENGTQNNPAGGTCDKSKENDASHILNFAKKNVCASAPEAADKYHCHTEQKAKDRTKNIIVCCCKGAGCEGNPDWGESTTTRTTTAEPLTDQLVTSKPVDKKECGNWWLAPLISGVGALVLCTVLYGIMWYLVLYKIKGGLCKDFKDEGSKADGEF